MSQTQSRLFSGSFVLLFAISAVVCIAMNMLNVIIPLYVTENLGGTVAISGFLSTAYTVASCLSRPMNGVLADRLGRRTMMCIGSLVFGLSCVLCGLIPVIIATFLCRIAMGLGYSAASTAVNTASTDVIPTERLSQGIGLFGISQSVATAAGPALATLAIALSGNVGALYATAVLCGIALLVSGAVRYERNSNKHAKVKRKGGALFESTAILPSLVQGGMLLFISCFMCFMTLYIVDQGYGATAAGTFFVCSSVTIIAVRLGLSRLVGRVPHWVLLVPGFSSLLLMSVLIPMTNSAVGLWGCALLYGLGLGTVWMTMNAEAVKNAPPERRGTANATFFFAFDAAIGIGAALWGVLIDKIGFIPCFHLAGMGFLILGIASVFLFSNRRNKKA